MKRAGKGILLTASVALLSGCLVDIDFDGDDHDDDRDRIRGSGIAATVSRAVAGFSQVSISGVGRLIIEQGEFESLTITADDNLLRHLESRVQGGRLFLGPDDGIELDTVHEIVYRLTVLELDAIHASGVTQVTGNDLFSQSFVVNVSGVSSVNLTGEAELLDVSISGVSQFWGRDFLTLDTRVTASGVTEVVVNVRDRLDATASGASTIRYLGSPAVFANVSGAGSVRHF